MAGRKKIIPDFGPLSDVRVLSMGSIVAGPNNQPFGRFWREVIHIERPGMGDT